MKANSLGLLLTIVALLVSGCSTLRPDSNLTVATLGVPNPPSPDALVYLSANRVNDHTYEIIAQGDASLRAEQFERAWTWMADKLAAGRPYDKQTKVDSYEYFALVGDIRSSSHRFGMKVTGRMTLK